MRVVRADVLESLPWHLDKSPNQLVKPDPVNVLSIIMLCFESEFVNLFLKIRNLFFCRSKLSKRK